MANLNWLLIYTTLGWLIRAMMLPVVLRRQFTPGASIAWLGIVYLHPYIGLALYLLLGEARLGPGRVLRHQQLLTRYQLTGLKETRPAELHPRCQAIAVQAMKVGRMPVVAGSRVEFLRDSGLMIDQLVSDIEQAASHVHLLYYMVSRDATGQRVAKALAEAAGRGVHCRLLADEYASRPVFRRGGLAQHLRASGVEVAAALPSSPLRRRDVRNHRKLAVIDGRLAYSGSQNLIDPDYGGRRGAPWVDLTGRFTGPVVGEFAAVFAADWAFETGNILEVPSPADIGAEADGAPMQVVPTGPVSPEESYRRVLLGAIQLSTERLIITTPYFVPDDPTMVSLLMAADRGVDISLIVPEHPDHFFTASAGRAHYSALLTAGAKIFLYRPGLIHAKLITVDDTLGMIGSANLDIRSFHLNFELTTLLYGQGVIDQLRAVQQTYMADSRQLDVKAWTNRNFVKQYADAAVSLVSPLL
jgi:cardiolipin synthase